MWLIVTIANPLFSAMGSTEVFRIGMMAIYAESLLYGACAGGMLASVFMWFSSYSACMNSDNSLALFGNIAPVVTLMITQVMRLVPQFGLSARAGGGHGAGCRERAAPQTKGQKREGRFRIVSIPRGVGHGRRHRAQQRHARSRLRLRCASHDLQTLPLRASADAAVVAVIGDVRAGQRRLGVHRVFSVSVLPDGERAGGVVGLHPVRAHDARPPSRCGVKEWWLWRSLK